MFDAWKQRQRQRLENRPERTVFYNIFATMMLVLAVELLMAVASILAINVTGQLDENAKDLLTMRVRNRASYVQEILRNAEDLEQLSEQITATTQQLLKSGDISLDTLDNSSEQSDALLVALAPQLLDTLRTKQVTGIFLILNTHDLDTCEVGKKMPGIYLRDMDPDARPSERNSDLLLERASATVVKELAIGTDKGWQPAFPYQGDTKGGILRTVFQTAYKSDAGLSAESYGRWTTNSYCLAGDDRHAIAYSMPLILPDGTVYGVVGVELLTDYLQTKLPFTELDEDKAGTYFIVTTTDDALTDGVLSLRKTVTSGEDLVTADAPLGVLNCRSNGNGGNWVELNDKRYYMVLEPLQVYNRNAPFAAEKWFLAGTMEQSVLLAFSSRVREVLLTTIAITLVLSVLGSLLVSARLARPINRLYREVIDAQEKKTFPRLSRTAIREVDRFAETITELNKELVTNSTKFLRIMDMASVEIGGYELRTDTGSVFVTDNFFSLLGKPEMQGEPLSVRRFEEALKGIAYTKIVAFDGGTNAVEHCVIKDFDQKEIGSRCIDAMEQIAAGNGNKDGYSIRAAALDLAKRTERRKILMVLSDGLPSGYFSEAEAIDDVRTAVQAARRRGLLVIPIIYTARTDENVDAYRRMYEKSMIFADSVGMLGEFERLLMKLVR